MRPVVFMSLACALTACVVPAPATPPAATPTPIVGAVVDPFKVVVTGPVDGVITVAGKPNAVYGAPATSLTLVVLREIASPAPALRLLHLEGGGLPIASASATLLADGSFAATPIGDPARAVQAGDELNLTPVNGVAQAGFPLAIAIR